MKEPKGRKEVTCVNAVRVGLTEFEAKAESQLILLDLSVSVDVTVTHQGFPELVQVCSTDAGLEEKVRYCKARGQLVAGS